MRLAPLVWGALLVGCAATPGVYDREIIGGVDDDGDPAVVLWVAQQQGSTTATLCTATVISPHVVLTAAHCVSPASVGANETFSLFTGASIAGIRASALMPIPETHFDPEYDNNNIMAGHDIAVGIMANPLGIPPLPLNRKALSSSMKGQPVRMIGYGTTDGSDTAGKTAGRRRQVTSQLDSFSDQLVRFGMAGQTTCEGDSGGPGLMTIDGVEVVVGVVSFGDTTCTELDYDTRVDAYINWIAPYVAAADPGDPAGMPAPKHGCAFGGGSNGGVLFIVILLLATYRRRYAIRGGASATSPSPSPVT
jgi:secreted trypsin-like serine protease